MATISLINDGMQFLNCCIPLPSEVGLSVVSSGCGSGKTTMITAIIKSFYKAGIVVVVPTIEAADELYRKAVEAITYNDCSIRVLHSKNYTEMDEYRKNPERLSWYDLIIITSARMIIDPIDLFLAYKDGKTRQYLLIDEMINFYPEPFAIPSPLSDILTYIDHVPEDGEKIAEGVYKHIYSDIAVMKLALDSSEFDMFPGKSSGLTRYKTDHILNHIHNNGLTPLLNKVRDFADRAITILLDGTADILFPKDRLLPVTGHRYESDIRFHLFHNTIKRHQSVVVPGKETLITLGHELFEMIAKMTVTGHKVLVICWKTITFYPPNNGMVDDDDLGTGNPEVFEFTQLLTDCLVTVGAEKDNLAVIYRGSGQDRGSNEYRDFDTVVFLGGWNIPNTIVSDINSNFGIDCSFKDYMLSLMVQTICRTQIRKHIGLSIDVYFSDDIDYDLVYAVQEYFKVNSDEKCSIDGIACPCKKYSKPEKRTIVDVITLYPHYPQLKMLVEDGKSGVIDITLDELYKLLPKPRKAKDRYTSIVSWLSDKGITLNITTTTKNF